MADPLQDLQLPVWAPAAHVACSRYRDESDRAAVTALVDASVGSDNLMVAVRIRGEFASVRTRTVSKQEAPYPPFTEATRDQNAGFAIRSPIERDA